MMHSILTPYSNRTATIRRRALLAGVALTAFAGWTGAGPALGRAASRHQDDALPADLWPPQGATYAGPTDDPETLVAIVLPDDALDTAVAYLCRGPELNLWFTGRMDGGALTLAQPDPAADATPAPGLSLTEPTLTGQLTASGINGEAALPDGALAFTAIPAGGVAGLYVTERDDAGVVRGASSTGATLRGRQVAATGADLAVAPFRLLATVTAADGRRFELVIPAHTEGAAFFRWVALANGDVRGAGRRRDDDDDPSVMGTVKF